MPEEINRLLTDRISDLLFTPSADADENLIREGIDPRGIHLVGNCMIDTLIRFIALARRPAISGADGRFALLTLHRPSNVDDARQLEKIVEAVAEISRDIPIVFPIHPRTRQRLASIKGSTLAPSVHIVDPQGYLEFLWLLKNATLVITDSGGVQEESTFLGVPCLTMRLNTERPVTCTTGTNVLVGDSVERLKREVAHILSGRMKTGVIPPLWDGHAGARIARVMASGVRENEASDAFEKRLLSAADRKAKIPLHPLQ